MDFLVLVPFCLFIALGFAFYLVLKICNNLGNVDSRIKTEAQGFFYTYYSLAGRFLGIVFLVLFLFAYGKYFLFFVPFGFLSSALFPALSVFVCAKALLLFKSSVHLSEGPSASSRYNILFYPGAVFGFFIIGFAVFDLTLWFVSLQMHFLYNSFLMGFDKTLLTVGVLLSFGFGASCQAWIGQIAGGIWGQAVQHGHDLIVQRETNLSQDDEKNPAFIARAIGSTVEGALSTGSDYYESLVLAVLATSYAGVIAGVDILGLIFALLVISSGMVFSVLASWCLPATVKTISKILYKRILLASVATAGVSYFFVSKIFGPENMGIFWAVGVGLFCGFWLQINPFNYSFQNSRTSLQISFVSKIKNFLLSSVATVTLILIIVIAAASSFLAAGGLENFDRGFLGVGLSAVGMLSVSPLILSGYFLKKTRMAISQDEGAEISYLDLFESAGQKISILATALTAIVLLSVFKDQVIILGHDHPFELTHPSVYIGLFIGVTIPYLFSTAVIAATTKVVREVVVASKGQVKVAGVDYRPCIDKPLRLAFRESTVLFLRMLLAILLVHFFFSTGGIGGFIVGVTISSIVLAIMMHDSKINLDAIPKYIEDGQFARRGLLSYKTSLMENPFKKAAQAGLNTFVKLVIMTAIVLLMLSRHG